MDHGQGLAGLDLVPAEGEGEAAGELFDAAVRLHVRAPADAPALLLLLQTQVQLRETEEENMTRGKEIRKRTEVKKNEESTKGEGRE